MSTRDFFAKKEEFLKMASKSKKRYLARQYMAAKSITQHVPNKDYLKKIQKRKEDLIMSKFLQKILTASVRVLAEREVAKSTDAVRLFAAEYKRLEIASEILAHFDGPSGCEPVDAGRLELSIDKGVLANAMCDVAAVRREILEEGEKLPSAKLHNAIQWARCLAAPADTED